MGVFLVMMVKKVISSHVGGWGGGGGRGGGGKISLPVYIIPDLRLHIYHIIFFRD